MAPIYKEITLEWKGKTYSITPTYAMIQNVEQTLSLAALLHRLDNNPPLSQLADLLALVLGIAGCTDPELTGENLNQIFYHGSDEDREVLSEAASMVLFALVPPRDLSGNAETPPVKPPEGGKEPVTSDGQSITKLPSDTAESSLVSSGR
jgi:hypothetical protein